MKKITKILVSVIVLATIAACGASPRPGRSALSTDEAVSAALPNGEVGDAYRFADMAALVTDVSLLAEGINVDDLGISMGTGVDSFSVDIVVGKTTKTCVMTIHAGQYDDLVFTGTAVVYLTTNVTCSVVDSLFPKNPILINIAANGTSAWVTIDDTYSYDGKPFMQGTSFLVNPKD